MKTVLFKVRAVQGRVVRGPSVFLHIPGQPIALWFIPPTVRFQYIPTSHGSAKLDRYRIYLIKKDCKLLLPLWQQIQGLCLLLKHLGILSWLTPSLKCLTKKFEIKNGYQELLHGWNIWTDFRMLIVFWLKVFFTNIMNQKMTRAKSCCNQN